MAIIKHKPLDKKILLIKLKAILGPYNESKWLLVQLNKGHVTTEKTQGEKCKATA